MKHTVTLHEIYAEYGISRKAIQGYEQLGLIRSCGKDRYGHLLYDHESLSLIIRIRFFQKLGFSLKQIILMNAGNIQDLIPHLEMMITETDEEIDALEKRIELIKELIRDLKDGKELNMEKMIRTVKEDKE